MYIQSVVGNRVFDNIPWKSQLHSLAVKLTSRLPFVEELQLHSLSAFRYVNAFRKESKTHFLLFIERQHVETAKWNVDWYHSQANDNGIECMVDMNKICDVTHKLLTTNDNIYLLRNDGVATYLLLIMQWDDCLVVGWEIYSLAVCHGIGLRRYFLVQ